METKFYATKCDCGAITIDSENKSGSISMRPTLFKKIRKQFNLKFEWLNKCYCCNHCVNHWGIDICSCGSGEKVGKCECGDNAPFQDLDLFLEGQSNPNENILNAWK